MRMPLTCWRESRNGIGCCCIPVPSRLERLGEWERAEPEFRRVLEFVPDEPQVLNYLGYSLMR